MANILSTDDSTLAASLGNWEAFDPALTDVTRQTGLTSPDGNNVARLEQLNPSGVAVVARIPRGVYPIANGDELALNLDFMVPGTNTGTGRLFCQALVVIYPANPAAAGAAEGLATSTPFDPGDGWLHLAVPEFTVGPPGGSPATWVGLQVTFSRWDSGPIVGITHGDFAYFSDIVLGAAEVGGWAVGMVRMEAT